MGYQSIFLVGNVGGDPKEFTTEKGDKYCTFNLAVNRGSGEKKQTEWFNCIAWRDTADYAMRYVTKGTPLFIEGYMKSRKVSKDGVDSTYWSVNINRMEFMSKKRPGDPDNSGEEEMF